MVMIVTNIKIPSRWLDPGLHRSTSADFAWLGFSGQWNEMRMRVCRKYYRQCSTHSSLTTLFVDTRLWKTKHPRKRFQNFRQSCVILTDRIEMHQSQPNSMTYRRLEGYTIVSGCNWWISIRSVNNTQDWLKFWKRFPRCFVFQSRVSTKTMVKGHSHHC